MNKKKLPLKVLKALEPFVGMQGELFTIEHPGNNLLLVKDKDPNSKFYYTIEKHQIRDGKDIYSVIFAPKNDKEVGAYSTTIGADDITTTFNSWVLFLENYSKVKSFFDDPILESYQAEFFSNFEFVDEHAETNPFQTAEILQLDYLLEHVSTRLIELSDENNREANEVIVAEIAFIRESLTNRSQKWVVEQISNIYAKIAKQGVPFIKEFWAEGKKELIKIGIKALIESAQNLIS
ncbi:hypothetical protein [Chryseobacterium sp.]|uniref:hypothetical protein n=1 Tax=Chryseobacterium sp. TaxID=1871047 RepID=UPI000ED6FFB3|nr:hypothetical protein [Chryseobacterium sp.]HCA10032.1 hypothetical protein [Chryseobacterium sp.]